MPDAIYSLLEQQARDLLDEPGVAVSKKP